MAFGLMYHGMTYPDEAYSEETKGKLTVNFWHPVMKNGIIEFCRPSECIYKTLREMPTKKFGENNVENVDVTFQNLAGKEEN